MGTWEYSDVKWEFYTMDLTVSDEKNLEKMNRIGERGWELVAIGYGPDRVKRVAYFKRQVKF